MIKAVRIVHNFETKANKRSLWAWHKEDTERFFCSSFAHENDIEEWEGEPSYGGWDPYGGYHAAAELLPPPPPPSEEVSMKQKALHMLGSSKPVQTADKGTNSCYRHETCSCVLCEHVVFPLSRM
eukprot:6480649-Amphidinium_carterae.1